ncbi:hypothetical protein AB0A77_28990 [Streptomyces varsoviensis]|uniref:hypothetical protein n=1 Tax=Streptomyces varsoviensis TaxID=67373 RepID=UPI0033F68314
MPASKGDRALAEKLAGARLRSAPYTAREVAAGEARVAARLADRLLRGALSFDDAVQPAARLEEAFGRPPRGSDREQAEERQMREAAEDLRRLCRLVVGQPDALHQMTMFIGAARLPEPAGARVLACVLQLAGREDSARFWWQYAAGAGDTSASYCLFLHHMTLAEVHEAAWWHAQADPDACTGTEAEAGARAGAGAGADRTGYRRRGVADAYDTVVTWGIDLEIVMDGRPAPTATEAVVCYVTNAVEYVDEVDLPLPTPGFAERIEELTTT